MWKKKIQGIDTFQHKGQGYASGRGSQRNVDAVFKEELDIELQEGHIVVLPGILNSGFDFPSMRYAVISDRKLGSKKRPKEKKSQAIEVFTDLKVGDYVVHENHG